MAEVRLAELVAALSLGVDLGFGQPMEHVLRQCMIALRLADRIGLDEAERSTVYYTALLVNVGCHADAHEQAKWFGDDIALKSGKYDHELRSVRAAAAALSLVGSGNPPLHRFRVGLEFAISGRRDLDGMIAQHAALRAGAGRAARSAGGSAGSGRLLVRAVGRQGLARRSGGREDPGRGTADAVRGVRRGRAPGRRRRRGARARRSGAAARSSTRRCCAALRADPEGDSRRDSTPPTPGAP